MLAGATYEISQGYDYGNSLKHVLNKMGKTIPLFIMTDSKSISDTISKSKRLRELRLMNYFTDMRCAYSEDKITNIGWIRSYSNIADNLTRENGNHLLDNVFVTSYLQFTI